MSNLSKQQILLLRTEAQRLMRGELGGAHCGFDGAMPGNYKVALNYVPDTVADMPGFTGGKKSEPSTIPAKYGDSDKSNITATVEKDKSKNEYKFDLTD